jgi:two-component system sensor histidine kinase KdpD
MALFSSFASSLLVALATLLLWFLHSSTGITGVCLLYLIVVALVAVRFATRTALWAACLSAMCTAFFFLPPIFSLKVAAHQDVLILITFFSAASVLGGVVGRLRKSQAESLLREQQTAALYRATQSLSRQVETSSALACLIEQLQAIRSICRCCLLDEVGHLLAGQACDEGEQARALRVAQSGKALGLNAPVPVEPDWPICESESDCPGCYLPLLLGARCHGVLVAIPQPSGFTANEARLLVSFATQAAACLERQRLLRETAYQENERLRSVLFSSLSHNLKTPLASLKATLSSLRQQDVEWAARDLQDGLEQMHDDASRLQENIDNLLDLASLEAGLSVARPDWVELGEVVELACRHLTEGEYARLRTLAPAEQTAWLDGLQMAQVLRHLLENALTYSQGMVYLGVQIESQHLVFSVEDQGPGVAACERELIFKKFYRGQAALRGEVRGTGLGLSICREIVAAHGGLLEVRASSYGGACFYVQLPHPAGGGRRCSDPPSPAAGLTLAGLPG